MANRGNLLGNELEEFSMKGEQINASRSIDSDYLIDKLTRLNELQDAFYWFRLYNY